MSSLWGAHQAGGSNHCTNVRMSHNTPRCSLMVDAARRPDYSDICLNVVVRRVMRAFLGRNLFCCVLVLVVALHAGAAYWFSREEAEPPTPLPSRIGKASMSVRASRGARPKIVGEGGPGSKASKGKVELASAELDLPPLRDPLPPSK